MTGIIYARYSSDNQREESIEGQLRECNDFAKRMTLQSLIHILTEPSLLLPTGVLRFKKRLKILQRICLMLSSFGSWTGSPVIVMTLLTTRHSFARTLLRLYLQMKISAKALRVSFLNPYLRVWLNTIRLTFRKR